MYYYLKRRGLVNVILEKDIKRIKENVIAKRSRGNVDK